MSKLITPELKEWLGEELTRIQKEMYDLGKKHYAEIVIDDIKTMPPETTRDDILIVLTGAVKLMEAMNGNK